MRISSFCIVTVKGARLYRYGPSGAAVLQRGAFQLVCCDGFGCARARVQIAASFALMVATATEPNSSESWTSDGRMPLVAFTDGVADCLQDLCTRLERPTALDLEDMNHFLSSCVDHARRKIVELGELLYEVLIESQRKALRVQASAFQLKLNTSRRGADIRLLNQKAELEHAFTKMFHEKITELTSNGDGDLVRHSPFS